MKRQVTIEHLKRIFNYDPETGELTRAVELGRDFLKGSVAGSTFKGKYRTVHVSGKRLFVHRVAWAMYYGEWPKGDLDHINRDGKDNRIANLRECTATQNVVNKPPPPNNSSGFKGVYFNKREKSFKANIRIDKRCTYLGRFDSAEEAAMAYDKAALEHHGEFAYLNFPERICDR